MRNKKIFNLVLASALIAMGWTLPLATGQIKEIGKMLCPMHLPLFIGAFMLGPWYGIVIGLIMPITRSLIFQMPVLFPSAVCMSIELATYGFVSGFLFNYVLKKFKKNTKQLLISTFISLIVAMIIGRIVWGLASMVCYGIKGTNFTMQIFMKGALIEAWPGIIIQLILIPALVLALRNKFIEKEEK